MTRLEQIEAHIKFYRRNVTKQHDTSLPDETRAEAKKRAAMHMRYASRLCSDLSMEGVTDEIKTSAKV